LLTSVATIASRASTPVTLVSLAKALVAIVWHRGALAPIETVDKSAINLFYIRAVLLRVVLTKFSLYIVSISS
jgi:hypothetical protein